MNVTKRFIAGAVCPRCGEMDRLVIYTNEVATFKECVSCSFIEKQLVVVEQRELETRVNESAKPQPEATADVQIIKLIKD